MKKKKSKCVENGHYPVEKTRKFQEIFLYVKEFNNMNLKLEVCNKRGISNYLFNTFFISIFNTIKTFGVMQIQFHFNFYKRTSTPHLEI